VGRGLLSGRVASSFKFCFGSSPGGGGSGGGGSVCPEGMAAGYTPSMSVMRITAMCSRALMAALYSDDS